MIFNRVRFRGIDAVLSDMMYTFVAIADDPMEALAICSELSDVGVECIASSEEDAVREVARRARIEESIVVKAISNAKRLIDDEDFGFEVRVGDVGMRIVLDPLEDIELGGVILDSLERGLLTVLALKPLGFILAPVIPVEHVTAQKRVFLPYAVDLGDNIIDVYTTVIHIESERRVATMLPGKDLWIYVVKDKASGAVVEKGVAVSLVVFKRQKLVLLPMERVESRNTVFEIDDFSEL